MSEEKQGRFLEAVLLFHSGGPWDADMRAKVLCDVVRKALEAEDELPTLTAPMCLECGASLEGHTRRRKYCSRECGDRRGSRIRQKRAKMKALEAQ